MSASIVVLETSLLSVRSLKSVRYHYRVFDLSSLLDCYCSYQLSLCPTVMITLYRSIFRALLDLLCCLHFHLPFQLKRVINNSLYTLIFARCNFNFFASVDLPFNSSLGLLRINNWHLFMPFFLTIIQSPISNRGIYIQQQRYLSSIQAEEFHIWNALLDPKLLAELQLMAADNKFCQQLETIYLRTSCQINRGDSIRSSTLVAWVLLLVLHGLV